MIAIFWCITFELKGSLLKHRGLLKLFSEGRLEHLLHIAESFTSSSVLPRVIGYMDALGHFFGFTFQKPGEELLNFFFSHLISTSFLGALRLGGAFSTKNRNYCGLRYLWATFFLHQSRHLKNSFPFLPTHSSQGANSQSGILLHSSGTITPGNNSWQLFLDSGEFTGKHSPRFFMQQSSAKTVNGNRIIKITRYFILPP